jgi:hypothetical protein
MLVNRSWSGKPEFTWAAPVDFAILTQEPGVACEKLPAIQYSLESFNQAPIPRPAHLISKKQFEQL